MPVTQGRGGGLVVLLFGGLVDRRFACLVIWLFGYLVGLVVWWFLHWGEVVEPSGWLMERLHLTKQPNHQTTKQPNNQTTKQLNN